MLWCCCKSEAEVQISTGALVGTTNTVSNQPSQVDPLQPYAIQSDLSGGLHLQMWYVDNFAVIAPYSGIGSVVGFGNVPAGTFAAASLSLPLGRSQGGGNQIGGFDLNVYLYDTATTTYPATIPRSRLLGPVLWQLPHPIADGVYATPDIAALLNQVTLRNGVRQVLAILEPTGSFDSINVSIPSISVFTAYGPARLILG